jgi:ubiquinone/menaquinone biosynthesis C-methylase UbiE
MESCRTDFWKAVFEAEIEYLAEHLTGCKDVLSVGCGPAIIEGSLSERGFHVTGLDVSREALDRAPDTVRTVVASAEDMPFPASSFDAVIYVASLQFIEDYAKAMKKTAHVLRPDGRLIVMLLNPESDFFKRKLRDPNSYVCKIRHTDLQAVEDAIAEHFAVETEFFLGIEGDTIFESRDAADAALYVIRGTKKPPQKGKEA